MIPEVSALKKPIQAPIRLVLLRHGQSVWNRDKVFTGWSDVALSPKGQQEAQDAAHQLQQAGFAFDSCFSSTLQRALETAKTVLSVMELNELPIQQCWRLNERHYGALEGMGRWSALKKFGVWPVLRTQIRFDGVPPSLALDDARFPGNHSHYGMVEKDVLPRGESLKQAGERLLPFWQEVIKPELLQGKRVLIVSHKNVLRTLMMQLSNLSQRQVMKLKLATGRPLIYELDHELNAIQHYYVDEMPGK
ncbi:2,3-bisphosphoglycerate-dependent phosphoglycerate mutase [Nitrosomonas aestuarii]|uniref:2,3-bisphosphoglycerate-dependent phosphoglycerate mutase n=1 Tax=Nitrosomonas aestuarii TaxID=52441 RepID=UPI000D31053A|nr:2,3-bisphosphoglycerate-dependent phosphoglycerate mutase [Nitrosomonas aestuarii]PTN11968.1 phosphoglycerate mutase [Nitrosomonas aestuarii]